MQCMGKTEIKSYDAEQRKMPKIREKKPLHRPPQTGRREGATKKRKKIGLTGVGEGKGMLPEELEKFGQVNGKGRAISIYPEKPPLRSKLHPGTER